MSIILDGTNGITSPDVVTNDGQVYAKENILGTVSESGGVPTGAIIERGSNANGEFVKYADGTIFISAQAIQGSAGPNDTITRVTLPIIPTAIESAQASGIGRRGATGGQRNWINVQIGMDDTGGVDLLEYINRVGGLDMRYSIASRESVNPADLIRYFIFIIGRWY